MGYDLHITRADDWSDSAEDPISADEWLAAVRSDPELSLDPQNGECFAVWKSGDGWLDWSAGQIQTKNPDRALVAKMIAIADRLGAKVQGDDGEDYATLDDFPES